MIALACFNGGFARASDFELTHATIYTAPDRVAIHDGTILVHDGRIVAVGPAAAIGRHLSPRHLVYDCTGFTITAGFWNSHVHILPPPLLHAEQQSSATLNAQLETMFTRWGFTSVFDIASPLANTNLIRRRIASGILVGPRILTTGEPFWTEIPVYVQRYLAENHLAMPVTTSVPDATSRVDRQVRDGADGVKIFAGSIESNGVVLLPAEIARAIVDEAHRDHRIVFSHPSSIKGVELSLDSGVDILAHVSSFEGLWPPPLIERMLAAHISLIPTLTLFDVEGKKDGASTEGAKQLVELAVGQLHSYASRGGEILFGTDIGYIDHYDTAEEFTLMTEAGMSFPQILGSLTTVPSARFGYQARNGRIAAGMDADLVVLRSDPAQDITALSRVVYTIRAGRFVFGKP
jgi:imidazolonepropionase-like amidohydrolase